MSDESSDRPARVRAARAYAGLGHREFAERLGISESTLRRLERGEKEPTVAEAARIAEVAGVPSDWVAADGGLPASATGRVENALVGLIERVDEVLARLDKLETRKR